MCCQESGERVAKVSLDCPNAPAGMPKSREVRVLYEHMHIHIWIFFL